MASSNSAAQPAQNSKFRVLTASLVGTTIEFFDFYIYATAAVIIFPYLFFPASTDPMTATIQSLATNNRFTALPASVTRYTFLFRICCSMLQR